MRVLVTNDDGVGAPGIAALAAGLLGDGHDVLVVAPLHDASGAGTATGAQRRDIVDTFRCEEGLAGGAPAFGVDASPALCVIAASSGAFGVVPDVVVAGVNAGRNIGRSVLHSGTVGAALTAAQMGLPALALSMQVRRGVETDFAPAVWLGRRLLPAAAAGAAPVLNCNLPAAPLGALAGVRLAPLGNTPLVRMAEVHDGHLRLEFRRDLGPDSEPTDETLTEAGFATVTPLSGIGTVIPAPRALHEIVAAASAALTVDGGTAGR